MSRIDPECFSHAASDEPVCAECLGNEELKALALDEDGEPGCSFCGGDDAPTCGLDVITTHLIERLHLFYGKAVDQLPYESAEGGYQGWNVDTATLLIDEVEIDLPRDSDERLFWEIHEAIGDDAWCDFDWLALPLDRSLISSWEQFSQFIMHQQRFFFALSVPDDPIPHPDERSPLQLLSEIIDVARECGIIRTVPKGSVFYRARDVASSEARLSELGPPPPEISRQSNRLNPPGIPIFYGAETEVLALSEIRADEAWVGTFRSERDLLILDLVNLPEVPSWLSSHSKSYILGLRFLHSFTQEITQLVEPDDRIHVEYVPSQVFAEFIRYYSGEGVSFDGIRYPTSLAVGGVNIALFFNQGDICDKVIMEPEDDRPLSFIKARRVKI